MNTPWRPRQDNQEIKCFAVTKDRVATERAVSHLSHADCYAINLSGTKNSQLYIFDSQSRGLYSDLSY